jgi:OmcA/MtrC family decaheme c-type cytochrome
MTAIFRALVVLATAGAISFPTQTPPTPVTSNASERRRAVAISNPNPATRPDYKPTDLEFYLTDDGIAYIRPGLNIKLSSISIPADRKPLVDVTLMDGKNQPLDRLGETTPGAVSVSFILASYDPGARHYTSYTTRSVTAPANSPRPGAKAIQAGADAGGTWTSQGSGRYTYKFATALPADFDQTKTTTLGYYATRNLTTEIGKNYYFDDEKDFRPDGQTLTATWDKLRDTSCQSCHDPATFGLHGGPRKDVKLCVLCHQPQTTDPDTGNTMDFKVMLHKIHAGEELSAPYVIYGNGQSVHDYSEVVFPTLTGGLRNCTKCHEGETAALTPAQSHVWYTQPSRDACGACHDTINWVTGENHPAGPQTSDATCSTCHVPDSGDEFDASIKGAHTIPEASKQLTYPNVQIVSVSNAKAGEKPTVVFKITDKSGAAVDGSKFATFAPMHAGPTSGYKTYFRETATATSASKAIFDAATGNTSYTFVNPIPADATGTWSFSGDFYRNATLKRADGKADITGIRDTAVNPQKYVALTGAVEPRRTTVDIALCNDCHGALGLRLHGGQRRSIEECVMCHNPVENDRARRPADKMPAESVSFQHMIHRIHSGNELITDFTVYGFGNVALNFNHVGFPGDRRNCTACHVNNAQQLPVPATAGAVNATRDWFSPQGPGTAACLGCHDSRDAAAHAFLNTTTFAGQPAEACGTCHGTGRDWAVDKVHAR